LRKYGRAEKIVEIIATAGQNKLPTVIGEIIEKLFFLSFDLMPLKCQWPAN